MPFLSRLAQTISAKDAGLYAIEWIEFYRQFSDSNTKCMVSPAMEAERVEVGSGVCANIAKAPFAAATHAGHAFAIARNFRFKRRFPEAYFAPSRNFDACAHSVITVK
jgi:hypothetical protein